MHTPKTLHNLLESYGKEAEAHGFDLLIESSLDDNLFVVANPKTKKAKQSPSPFLLYAKAKSPELRVELGVTYCQALTVLGGRWKDPANANMKADYVELARVAKVKFDAENASTKDN